MSDRASSSWFGLGQKGLRIRQQGANAVKISRFALRAAHDATQARDRGIDVAGQLVEGGWGDPLKCGVGRKGLRV